MERTVRLVRLALAGLPGAADVAAAVVSREARTAAGGAGGVSRELRAGRGSASEGTHAAAGGAGGVSRELRAGRGSASEGTHAAAGAAGVFAHALLRAGSRSLLEGAHDGTAAGGGSGLEDSREVAHALLRAGSRSMLEGAHDGTAAGGGSGREDSREVAHALLRAASGSGSVNDGAHDGRSGGAREAVPRAKEKEKGGGRAIASQGDGDDYRQAEPPGRGLPLAASGTTTSLASLKVLSVEDKMFLPLKQTMDSLLGTVLSDDDNWSTDMDFTKMITSFITNSAEIVKHFHISCSKWTSTSCLEEWLELLSKRSVQEVDILNLGHRVTTVFPISSLQSDNLRRLRLGFVTLDLDLLCFNYSKLQILDIFCCSVEGNKLAWVITDCVSLIQLKVQYCTLDLHIKSNSLKYLYCIGNMGNCIVIDSAPNLQAFISGIVPKQQCAVVRQRIRCAVSLCSVPALNCITHLVLPYHKITVNQKDITKEIGSLPSVESLEMSLEMSNVTQIHSLRKLIESFPKLQQLVIKRMDNIGSDEGLDVTIDKPFQDIDKVECVRDSMKIFSVENFQGGPSEMHLIECILKQASNLIHLSTSACESSAKRVIRIAVKEIRSYHRVSEACRFSFA